MDLLVSRAVAPTPVPESGALPLSLPPPAAPEPARAQSRSARPDNSAPAAATTPFALASLLRPSYLHAEAWGSETLPVGAVVTVGIPRIYLTLGLAAGPPGPQRGGVAGGVGLGTAFEARGRFTPTLDLMQWFLSGDREKLGNRLTQLRPLLAWQIKAGGRLQLIAGPTLNLATGSRDGRTRGDGALGQGQWLWLNTDEDHSFLRDWPGLQAGLRF